jgi:hypothetical protein
MSPATYITERHVFWCVKLKYAIDLDLPLEDFKINAKRLNILIALHLVRLNEVSGKHILTEKGIEQVRKYKERKIKESHKPELKKL